ncbi:MAG TPA: hypothetical protein VEI97_09130 [bacterium]|nr:hypothetical protein [bacterium]
MPEWKVANFPIIGNIQYRECKGSPQESYSGDAVRVRRVFETPWADRWLFVVGMMGWNEKTAVGASTTVNSNGHRVYALNRYMPDVYCPSGHIKTRLIPTALESVEGLGVMGSEEGVGDSAYVEAATYEVARVTLNYETATFPVLPDAPTDSVTDPSTNQSHTYESDLIRPGFNANDIAPHASPHRYITRFVLPNAEALTLPHGSFQWITTVTIDGAGKEEHTVTPGDPVLGSHTYIVPTSEVHYVWHRVPGRPSAIGQLLGTVNNSTFDEYPRGTLLLLAAEFKPYRWVDGSRYCDVTYKMKHFSALDPNPESNNFGKPYSQWADQVTAGERGHNHFLRYLGSGAMKPFHDMLTHNGERPGPPTPVADRGIPVYREKDFSTLFNPDLSVTSIDNNNVLD